MSPLPLREGPHAWPSGLEGQWLSDLESRVAFLEGLGSPWGNNFLAWSMDPAYCGSQVQISNTGTFHGVKLCPPIGTVVTNIATFVTTIGASLTASDNWIGVYDSTGAQVGGAPVSMDSAWAGTTGLKQVALTSPFTVATPYVYAAVVCTGSTSPKLAGVASNDAVNAGTQGAGQALRLGDSAAGAHTTLPATLAASDLTDTALSGLFFVGLS